MEGNKILDTASELHTVNELLNKYVREQALSHEEKRGLWLFYKSINDTNSLIDFAEAAAHENCKTSNYSLICPQRKLWKPYENKA